MASDVDPLADVLVPGLAGLLDDIDQAVIVQDAAGRIQLLNVAAHRLYPDLDLGDEFERSGGFFIAEPGEAGFRRASGQRAATATPRWLAGLGDQ